MNIDVRRKLIENSALGRTQPKIDFISSLTGKDVSISRSKDPLMIWSAYVFVMLLILVVTLYKTLITGIIADTSYFSSVIALTFVCAFIYSYLKAYGLRREWLGINRIDDTFKNSRASMSSASSAERLAFSILSHDRPETIRIKDLVDSYYSTQEVPLRTLSVIAGLMVTLGLIGTILGLIISVGGLESVMTQVEGLSKGLLGGMKETIRGMAIAFYSTLFGAVLGAVVLRMLSVSLTNSLVQMSCGLFEYLELLPKSVEMTAFQPLSEVTKQFSELTAATASAKTELQKFTAATLDSRLANISAQLELCVAALKSI